MTQERTVLYEGSEIRYMLEEKPVKNLNLRIHKDCKVYVSARPNIPAQASVLHIFEILGRFPK